MNRPRTTDRHLPACMYLKHGQYWYVKKGKWTPLGAGLADAMAKYGKLIDKPAGGGMDKLLNRWLDQIDVKPNTRLQYEGAVKVLTKEMKNFTPVDVLPIDVAQLLDHHSKTPNMANRLRTVLKLAFDKAVRWGVVPVNPVLGISPFPEKKRDRYVTDDEYQSIREKAAPVVRIVMDLCYLTGQRIGDILAIKRVDVTEAGIAFAQEKTGKRLVIAMTPELKAVVAAAKTLRSVGSFFLVSKRNGKGYGYMAMRDGFRTAVEATDPPVPHTTLHDLRAKSITDAKKQGLDPQKVAGHDDARTTKIYLRDKDVEVVQGPTFRQSKTSAKSG